MVLEVDDVSRAFFEAPMQREMCIELPWEALDEHEKGQVHEAVRREAIRESDQESETGRAQGEASQT